MTQYMMSVYLDGGTDSRPAEEVAKAYADVDRFNEELMAAGSWVFAGGLRAPSTATVVRARDGEILTTDGPFSETKEQIGGFWIIEAPDLDAALRWAQGATVACCAPVEVRPFDNAGS
ncbi:MAG: YciI family protein [Acidimicrobiales bacterium]